MEVDWRIGQNVSDKFRGRSALDGPCPLQDRLSMCADEFVSSAGYRLLWIVDELEADNRKAIQMADLPESRKLATGPGGDLPVESQGREGEAQ